MDARLLDACRQFEAIMLRPMLDSLKLGQTAPLMLEARSDSDESVPEPGGAIVQSLFTDAFALAMVRAGGFGFADEVARAVSGALT